MPPEVSVIIPSYNTERYIASAIRSVLNQTWEDWELIIVDDASTDGSLAEARSFHDTRIKVFANEQNRGSSYTRNRAIAMASGKWIAPLDKDDLFAPTRLKRLMKAVADANVDMVADDILFIDAYGVPQKQTFFEADNISIRSPQMLDAMEFLDCKLAGFPTPRPGILKPLLKREFLAKHELSYADGVIISQDFVLYLLCLLSGARFLLVPEAGYQYRLWSGMTCSTLPTLEQLRDRARHTRYLLLQPAVMDNPGVAAHLERTMGGVKNDILWHEVHDDIRNKRLRPLMQRTFQQPSSLVFYMSRRVGNKVRNVAVRVQRRLMPRH